MHHFFTGLVYCVQELAFVGSVPRGRCGFSHLSIWISSASLHQTAEVHIPNDTEWDLAPTTPKMSSIWTAGLFFFFFLQNNLFYLNVSRQAAKTMSFAILGS